MKVIQQGDILFVKIDKIPQNSKQILPENNKYILARGEATGHSHAIVASSGVRVLQDKKGLYLLNNSDVSVVHEEHNSQTIPSGNWEVRRIKEWNYDKKQAERIKD